MVRAQSQIQRTLGTAEAMDRVVALLAGERFASRRALGRRVCAEFGFRDTRGRWQLAACLKALWLQRHIAIQSVIAWRLTVLTLLGRQVPELEPGLLLSGPELDFLGDYAQEYGLGAPDSLGAAMRLVAHFGGHRGRKHDRAPGHQTIWKGYNKLTTATVGHIVCSKWGGVHRGENRPTAPLS